MRHRRSGGKHGISRDAQDALAIESHRRASAAQGAGRFDEEIVPVPVEVGREILEFVADEHIRHDADAETMTRLKPVDEVGVIELNEAFAAQALAVMQELDLDWAKVDPNGGAIALGHPSRRRARSSPPSACPRWNVATTSSGS